MTPQDLQKLDDLISGKPTAPERIYNWQQNQMSIARHYGGLKYMGHDYTIAVNEPDQPLVRGDVLVREAKAARIAKRELSKTIREKIVSDQGVLL